MQPSSSQLTKIIFFRLKRQLTVICKVDHREIAFVDLFSWSLGRPMASARLKILG